MPWSKHTEDLCGRSLPWLYFRYGDFWLILTCKTHINRPSDTLIRNIFIFLRILLKKGKYLIKNINWRLNSYTHLKVLTKQPESCYKILFYVTNVAFASFASFVTSVTEYF